ncbi:MAG: hypothetical protein JWN99_2504 [Ilumatobacteraceae bacterium]|nr:hypothetical protein [Ilumatobacteraceae bacterium]
MLAVQIVATAFGICLILTTLTSALKTVVVPRAYQTRLTRIHFIWLRKVFDLVARESRTYDQRDRAMAPYAPLALVTLPAVWVMLIIFGFTCVDWGTGVHPFNQAFVTSGSSLMTLGFVHPSGTARVAVALLEAGIGLGIVSLMISYLPSIYSAFSRREALVGMLEVRAGLPPSPSELLIRYDRIGWLHRIDDDLFGEWEKWFIDVEESHTSQPSLVFFRSPHPRRSWITAAGCVLDTAAIVESVVDRDHDGRAAVLLRTGYLCLRRVSDFFQIPYDPDPQPGDPINVTRAEFDQVCVEMETQGLKLYADREQAWRDFAGWRVTYEHTLLALCALVMAPPALWSSDRMPSRSRVPIRRPKS